MRILVIEDELYLAESLGQLLKKKNYTVDLCHDGEAGFDYAMTNIYDLILLDIMLPKKDGLTVLKELREQSITTPIILLTARSEVTDKIIGLDQGADDYLAKPFDTEELLARIRANLRRRSESILSSHLKFGDLELDTSQLNLRKNDTNVNLTKKEAELLEYFILNKNQVISKEQLIEKIWGYDSEADVNHVEVYISFLRKKLSFIHSVAVIQTVRGVGYILKENEDV